MKKFLCLPIVWLSLLFFLPVVSWIMPGMPTLHDGQDHVARIANFYDALREGVLVPRWAANLNWGYGTPILMFLYPLPSYFASGFHALGFSLVTSTKLVFIVSYLFSGVAMYWWMRRAFGQNEAIIGSLLYQFAPYRFVDLHVRGAIGEHVAFIFPPLTFLFLFTRNWIGVSVSIAALILSHNAMAIMFVPLIALYGLYIFVFEEKNRWFFALRAVFFSVLGFALSAFFWVPALLEGKFTLRYIVTSGEALSRFVSWISFFTPQWNYGGTDTLSKFLGFAQWAGVALAFSGWTRMKKRKIRFLMVALFLLLGVSLFLMTEASGFLWSKVAILQNFQFPWRFLSLSVFVTAVMGGVSIPRIVKHRSFFFGYSMLIILGTCWMWWPKGFDHHDDSFYRRIYPSTTDTGESSPIWSVRFMEHTPPNPLSVVDGDVLIDAGIRTTTTHEYTIKVKSPSQLVEQTLYFPGWNIYLDGEQTGIQFQNPDYRGLMMFRVTPENNSVRVEFGGTKTRSLSEAISLTSAAVLGIITIWQKRKLYL